MFVAAEGVRLVDLREALERYSCGFDADLVTVAQAEQVVSHAAAIEKMAAALCASAAARVASTSAWRREGDRSAAHQLARKTGKSVASAVGMLGTAEKLKGLPGLAGATRRGELSPEQTAAIADAASADPCAEGRLLGVAGRSSLNELRESCARTRAAADGDGEARRRRIQKERFLRTHTDSEGAFNLSFRDNPEVGAEIMAVIRPLADRLALAARKAGRKESIEAHAADALAHLARNHGSGAASSDMPPKSTPGTEKNADDDLRRQALIARIRQRHQADAAQAGAKDPGKDPEPARPVSPPSAVDPVRPASLDPVPPAPQVPPAPATSSTSTTTISSRAKVIVRIDLPTLLRGYPVTGETCEIAGYGPVAVSAVRDMIETQDPFLAAVATDGEQITGVVHLGRRPNAAQQTALEWLYPTCAVEGCLTSVNLENDHRIDWADTHFTLLDLTDRLCPHHHGLKTTKNWSLADGHGKRAFVSPDDTRHPNSAAA